MFTLPQEPLLSDALHEVIGIAVVDREFQHALLQNPRKALDGVPLTPKDMVAAISVRGAKSLAEYAFRLEQAVAGVQQTRDLTARRGRNRKRAESSVAVAS